MATKTKLHPRNQHREGYDFARLVEQSPELEAFTISNPVGQTTIDFQDVEAVRMLNRALLKNYYSINFWDIPTNYLCPPIPGRVDYIHYLADLLACSNDQKIPRGRNIKALDIGTGASLVYPLIGQSEYGWHFTGVDIDPAALKSAQQICQFNKLKINLRQQNIRENETGPGFPRIGANRKKCISPDIRGWRQHVDRQSTWQDWEFHQDRESLPHYRCLKPSRLF